MSSQVDVLYEKLHVVDRTARKVTNDVTNAADAVDPSEENPKNDPLEDFTETTKRNSGSVERIPYDHACQILGLDEKKPILPGSTNQLHPWQVQAIAWMFLQTDIFGALDLMPRSAVPTFEDFMRFFGNSDKNPRSIPESGNQ